MRRRGELLRDRDRATAEVLFREAIEISRRQEAKLWELHSAVSFSPGCGSARAGTPKIAISSLPFTLLQFFGLELLDMAQGIALQSAGAGGAALRVSL
jgi:hypothetical protein